MNIEFDQSILTWHIATVLCYFSEAPLSTIKSDIRSSPEVSYSISNYTFHLLVTLITYPYVENIDDLPGKLKRDSSKSVLLAYAASHSRGRQHCQQLR
ncbi:hypothetical protein GQ457_06G020200 [Hibiscus cannabinus]